jgi:RNA polymerase sigma-70 factor (ECF subfamily)
MAGTQIKLVSSNSAKTVKRTSMPVISAKAEAPLSDQELAARVAGGDHRAFELLMRRFNRPLFRTARSIVKDDTEAEDVLQDAYLQAYRAMGSFRHEATLSTWLTRIVINEAIGRTRKTARRADIIELVPVEDEQDIAMEEPMETTTTEQPEQAMMRAQARQLLEKRIDALPDAFRTVFVLRALEEMSVEETAAALNIPEATVRTRFFRARAMLREALARELDVALEEAFSFDGARCDRIVENTLRRLQETD